MGNDLRRIVIATGNPHKVAELREMLSLPGVEFVGLRDLSGEFVEPAESGTTFEENAAIKAISYAGQTGLPCLADDSGLEVDALHGAPGVISSHYSTAGRETGVGRAERDAANNQHLLNALRGADPEHRTARFVCVMALAEPHGSLLAAVRGTFEGRIGLPSSVPRGANGFGYDPLFLVAPDFTHTSAELPAPEKNRLSHRGAAARAMLRELAHLLHAD
ncbi:MAG TPA: non-canonical purine NTP pyrophosphatase [Phycisphaerales bacterium]|nr:non-canonical purine NTP pyrophosphatase [Phycisphaerales bacterium]